MRAKPEDPAQTEGKLGTRARTPSRTAHPAGASVRHRAGAADSPDMETMEAMAMSRTRSADLMRFLLEDRLRPQAVLPNAVYLGDATVVFASGQQVGVPTH